MRNNQWHLVPGGYDNGPGGAGLYETIDRRYRARVYVTGRVDYRRCHYPGETLDQDDFIEIDSIDNEIRRLVHLRELVVRRDRGDSE